MRKTITILLTAFLLTGCGVIGDKGIDGALSGGNTQIEDSSSSDPQTYEGELGEKMSTMFFDFTVTDAYLSDSIGDVMPQDGNTFLVTEVTVKNTTEKDFSMFSTDFYLYYGNGEDDYALPRVYDDPDTLIMDGEFEDEYTLASGKQVSGYLIYEVPAGLNTFLISAEDIYTDSDGEEYYGDFYDVYIELK